jgi:hypothetical protein
VKRADKVLIDSTHRRWFVAVLAVGSAAYVLYRVLNAQSPEPLTGGSPAGLWYGVIGSLMMIYAGLLAGHRRVPVRHWLGRRQAWLRGHLWLGGLSGLFIWCHSGFSWGAGLTFALWIVLIGVLVTGLFGLIMQQVLPRLLTARVPCEAPYEQIPHLCEVMRRESDTLIDNVCGSFEPAHFAVENTIAAMQYASNARAQLRDFYEQDVRPFLQPNVPKGNPLLDPVQVEARFSKLRRLPGMDEVSAEVKRLSRFCEERRLLLEQERIHFWLHAWLLVHVPFSVALLVLGVVHVYKSLYY